MHIRKRSVVETWMSPQSTDLFTKYKLYHKPTAGRNKRVHFKSLNPWALAPLYNGRVVCIKRTDMLLEQFSHLVYKVDQCLGKAPRTTRAPLRTGGSVDRTGCRSWKLPEICGSCLEIAPAVPVLIVVSPGDTLPVAGASVAALPD